MPAKPDTLRSIRAFLFLASYPREYRNCSPDAPRWHKITKMTLSATWDRVQRYFTNMYLQAVPAPAGVKPVLKAWMELN